MARRIRPLRSDFRKSNLALNSPSSSPPPVPFAQRLTWGAGSLATISYLNVFTALALYYLTLVLKMDPALAGLLITLARLIDAFSDPLMGWITDHTRTSWGRRRPYLLLGAVICGASLPAVFSMHTLFEGLPPVWGAVMIVLVIYSLGFTIFNVPYLTIPVEMTRNRIQRLSLMSYRSAFMMVGAMLGTAGAPALVELLGGDTNAAAYQSMGLMFGCLVLVFMLIPFFGTRSAYTAPLEEQPALSLWQQVRTVCANRPFVLLIGAKCTQFVALAVTGGTTVFMFTVVLKQPFTLLPWLALATTFTILAGIPFWKWCGQFMTKRRGVLIGAAGETLASLTWLLVGPDWSREALIVFLVARGVISGIFGSAILLYSQAMWLDTIDHDQERTGLRREGLYTSVYVFVERLGYSAGPLLVGLFLGASGFDADLAPENQPASAVTAVLICMVAIPAIAQLGMLFFVWLYRLPEIIDGKTRI